MINTKVLLLIAAALGFGLNSSRAAAQDVLVNAPTLELASKDADLIGRGTRAFFQYLAACSSQDLSALKQAVTADAIAEYPLNESGSYLLVDATVLGGYCRVALAKSHVVALSVYPTYKEDVLLVDFEVRSDRTAPLEQAAEHLVMLEMRNDQILRMRDFSVRGEDLVQSIAHSSPGLQP